MNYNSNKEKEDNILISLIQTFFPFWPIFLILILGFLLAAKGYLHFAPKLYEASASIIIKDEQKGVDDSRIIESINLFESKKIVENEIEVLKSRDLMNAVVNSLNLYTPVYESAGIRSKSAYTYSPVKIIVKDPEMIEITEAEPKEYFFNYDGKNKEVRFSGEKYKLNEWIRLLNGQEIMFQKNERSNSKPSGAYFFNILNPKIITDGLVSKLNIVATNKLSSVVNLSIRDQVPERAEDIIDQLIQEYDQKVIEDKRTLALNTLAFIEERIANVEKDLDQLEYNIEEYRSNQGVIDLSEQGRLYLNDVSENDKNITELELQLAVLDNVENYVVSKGSAGGIVPSTLGINDAILSQLIENLYHLEVEYERLKKTTAENNPVLKSIDDQIVKIRPGILENVNSQKQNLRSRLANLNSNDKRFNSKLNNIPGKERALLEINRRKTSKDNLFSYLLQKREETALAHIPSSNNSTIINKAEASIEPVSPKPVLTYLIAFSLAILGGIGYVAMKEFLSGKILFRSEIEKYSKLPIIGELSYLKGNKQLSSENPEDILNIEQFRHLDAQLGLYSRTFRKKKILVTSSLSGEGKSFVSKNLAYSLAEMGKKVILLDMDFRKPNTSEAFNLKNHKGITDYLKEEITLEELVVTSELDPNLDILPAGTQGWGHTQLLLNGKLELLFEKLSESYDYVIMDSAPLGLVSDANLLAEFSEVVLLVVRHDFTPKKIIERLDQNQNDKTLQHSGIVFNGLKKRGFVKETSGYGYGYSQNYGYKL